MNIKAIFFDMGGTIETYSFTREYRVANAHLLRDCLQRGGIFLELSDKKLADVISRGCKNYHHWNIESMLEISTFEIWSKFVFKDYQIDHQALRNISEELSFLYETQFYKREMRSEVPEVLKSLRSMGLKIGCISNTQSLTQVPSTLRNYGIIEYFDPIVLSSQYGRRKPDPSIFFQAARQANVPTGSCIYVGDKINRDILGARRAGFGLAIQIRHEFDDREKDEGAIPDAVINSMPELLDILYKANKKENHRAPAFVSNEPGAFLFDAGDILYHRPRKRKKLRKFLNTLGRDLSDLDVETREKYEQMAFTGQLPLAEYREAVIRCYGITDPAQIRQGMKILKKEDNDLEYFEGVAETLKSLKNTGYLLGVITDTASPLSDKLRWLNQGGFGDVWDTVISSVEIGVRKPHPDIYMAALSQLGIAANQTFFIGHKSSELEGARAVGIKTIAFNNEPNARADYFITRFSDLLKLPIFQNCAKQE